MPSIPIHTYDMESPEFTSTFEFDNSGRLEFLRIHPDLPPPPRTVEDEQDHHDLSSEDDDMFEESMLPHLTITRGRSGTHYSSDYSPVQSRSSSPQPSLPSSATSVSICTIDTLDSFDTASTRTRPSVLRRLKSSVSSSSLRSKATTRPTVHLDDFRQPPEDPERRFIDGSCVVIPGVSDRTQCSHPQAHFVSTFRISEAIEYTTALADHGVTYTDYCRLTNMLLNFLDVAAAETKRYTGTSTPTRSPTSLDSPSSQKIKSPFRNIHPVDSAEMHRVTEDQAASLNQLLADITECWRDREIPVTVCVSSFSIFAPHRISEAQIQILHVPFTSQDPPEQKRSDSRIGQRLSFIDPLVLMQEETNASVPWLKRDGSSDSSSLSPSTPKARNQQSKTRDRSEPWPLWPNAIPSGKRQAMHDNASRYGADPYFRAWIRANINSRTTSSTYSKFMIEQENDPFINKRLPYLTTPPRNVWTTLTTPAAPSINRARYEHNRRLESRRTVENGTRLRILRTGLRAPLFPPHNAEMAALGLSATEYDEITSQFASFRRGGNSCPVSYVRSGWSRLRRRTNEDIADRVGAYVRELNTKQRRLVWTLERIPGAYDGVRGEEWEVSAWDGTCPLELLMDLERWGIVERRVLEDGEE